MANKEMKTIQFPNSEIVYEIVDNAAREALAGKQPSGNYATTESLNAHTGNTNNPHGVTKTQVGLENVANERQYSSQNPPPYPVTSVAGRTGAVTLSKTDVSLSNVDNTSDMNKPVSTAQATAIAEAKQAGTNAQNAIDTHAAQANNPHKVTAAQVGAYVKPASGIPETDLSAEVQEKLNASGGDTAVNLLQSSVTANRQAGVTEGDMVNLGYSLGLEEGKMYTVKYKFNDADIVAMAKYEAPIEGMITGATLALCQSVSVEGEVMAAPMLLGVQNYNASVEDYQSAAINYGFLNIVDKHQITDDETYTADENNCSVYLRAFQSENAQNAVSVEITAIGQFTEIVADKAIADEEGNNIVATYAKQNGNYSDMTVGNADKLGDKEASEYALKSDIKPRIYSTKTSVYPYKWEPKTWNGLTSFAGNSVWTDGNDIYSSNGSDQYVLNKATSTWESKTWSGRRSFFGGYIWTDGVDIYYSNGPDQSVLNRETSTLESKTWNGLTSFDGSRSWTDGNDIYYSDGTKQYVLNRETSTWESKTWSGRRSFFGGYIWTDGENIYYSNGTDHFVLNRETSTWETKTWSGLTSFNGYYIWTDGENIYYSNGTDQYKLTKVIPTTKTTLRR